jgi:tetratricopeptide (TPR) repeat protein
VKFRVIYVYIIFVIAAVSVLIIVLNSGNTQETGNIQQKQMPQDDIHKGIQNPTPPPSKDNVSESFKHELSNLKEAVEKNPNDTAAIKSYADLLAASHKPQESIPLYERILKKDSKRTDVLFSLSFIYYNSGDFKKAEDETNKILHLDKNNVQALYNLGAISASNGNPDEAKLIWSKLIKEYPNSDLSTMAKESLNKLK